MATPGSGGLRRLPDLIESLGGRSFHLSLMSALNELCMAEHCAVFRLSKDAPVAVTAASNDGSEAASLCARRYIRDRYWLLDTMFSEPNRRTCAPDCSISRLNIREIRDTRFRSDIYPGAIERVRMVGTFRDVTISLSVIKTNHYGPFSDEELGQLEVVAPILLSLSRKHTLLTLERSDFSRILSNLDLLKAVLAQMREPLPRREAEVTARILFGMSTAGIALDLQIAEETVATYRKRVYERLSIGTQRELLLWYLKLYGTLNHNASLCRLN